MKLRYCEWPLETDNTKLATYALAKVSKDGKIGRLTYLCSAHLKDFEPEEEA